MLKNKRILLIIIFAIALFLIPSICNAAATNATETTTTSTGKVVKWSYELEGDNIVKLKCINKSEVSGEVVIPSKLDGHKVVSFAEGYGTNTSIFFECEGLTGVTIPETVTKIGNYAFAECSSLNKVILPSGLINIGNNAFDNTGITSITIPGSVAKIGDYAFRNCSSLNSVVLNKGLTNIGNSAFSGCSALNSLELADGIVSIGNGAFYNTGLISVTIPNSVTSLGEEVFGNCRALKNITLSQNLTVINKGLFHDCVGLTSIIIPEKVTSIVSNDMFNSDKPFYNCSGLTKILIPDSVASIGNDAFKECNKLTIYGHDGQESKRYAEENNINFNYIENWNKTQVDQDITPPQLKSLEIDNSSAFKWDEGTNYYLVSAGVNIAIKATFEEIIFGETAPALTIKCGNGEKVELNNGAIQGSYIMYTYTIKEQDKGIITAVSMNGGDIADEAGNKVEKYVCPELVDDIWGHNVFANGKGSATTDEGNGNNNGGNNSNPSTTVTLSAITITKTPTKNTYIAGEKFDTSGMVITATYSDNSTKQITNYTVSPSAELKVGDTQVVITYTENGVTKTIGQKITVLEKTTSITLTSIKITKLPTKTKYTEGEKFNKSGMVITATYSDNSTKQITNYTVSPSGTLKTTNKKITVTYTENGVTKTAEQAISVVKDTTTKGDNKLPQTGATLLSLALISLIAVAVVSKVKYGKFKDI